MMVIVFFLLSAITFYELDWHYSLNEKAALSSAINANFSVGVIVYLYQLVIDLFVPDYCDYFSTRLMELRIVMTPLRSSP